MIPYGIGRAPAAAMRLRIIGSLGFLFACGSPVDAHPVGSTSAALDSGPSIRSAYLGQVNIGQIPFCPTPPAGAILEGMPVVFDRQLAGVPAASAFRITNGAGGVSTPMCATLAPANEEDEDDTVLLVGDFTPSADVAVVSVEVIGTLTAETGESLNGLSTSTITPVTESIHLVSAFVPSAADSEIGAPNGCPSNTAQVVRATFSGGLRVIAGVNAATRVAVRDANGALLPLRGISAAEEGDNDNILDVCLATSAVPATISLRAGTYTAPNGLPNDATSTTVSNGS